MALAGTALSRVQKDIMDFHASTQNDMWALPHRDDDGIETLEVLHSMVLGPPNSPYQHGFFIFQIQFSPQYPNEPPRVQVVTTEKGHTRFNPNLYASGKVCLSILGTWRAEAGESWSAAQNVESVLRSIQSLLHDNPYTNEPGFETASIESEEATKYNEKILHETLRVSVVGQLLPLFPEVKTKLRAATMDLVPKELAGVMKAEFLQRYQLYINMCEEWGPKTEGKSFFIARFEAGSNVMSGRNRGGRYEYEELKSTVENLYAEVNKETEVWKQEGKANSPKLTSTGYQLENSLQRLQATCPEGISLSLVDNNMYAWDVALFPSSGPWAGGCFSAEIIFSDEWPTEPARIKFKSKMFHPNVSPDGVPRITLKQKDCANVAAILKALLAVFTSDPCPDPTSQLNPEASKLYFSKEESERKSYRRKVRTCIEASVGN
eukprot:GFYU01003447.1.p1 GENE.GFYU01003447.1~~GFYU01003447.1.p1  ORF type:complete len:435 (-),score=87.71 GFYU01003447.1:424-1728(-)